MSRETPRWTRVSNPVTPTVVTFPDGDSTNAKPFTRISNPVTPTVVTFAPLPDLTSASVRYPEARKELLAEHAAPADLWRTFVFMLLGATTPVLDEGERAVFDLIVFGERTITEAATTLGLPRMVVFNRYQLALSKVRSELWNDLYLRNLIASVLNETSPSVASAVLLVPSRQSIDSVLNELSSNAV